MTSLIKTIKIKKGQKIAQLIVSNIMYPEIKKVDSLKKTERNNKGFNITKKEHIKEYNEHIKDIIDIYSSCSNLMNICCEGYFKRS